MKNLAFAFWLLLAPLPVLAQDEGPPPATLDETLDTLRRGADLLMQQFIQEMEPAVRDLAPLLQDLTAFAARLPSYHPPEILPNGDILLRRKHPEPIEDHAPSSPKEDDPSPGSEIEL